MIAEIRLAAAVNEPLHPSLITSAEVISLFSITASLYAKYDSCVTITSLVMFFRNQVTCKFTALRQYLIGSAKLPPPRLDVKTGIFQRSLDMFETSELQKIGGKVKTGEDKGRKGSTARCKYGIDAAGKQIVISQLIKKIAPEEAPDEDEEQETTQTIRRGDERPKKSLRTGKRAAPGGSTVKHSSGKAGLSSRSGSGQLCFLCAKQGHVSSKCNQIAEPEAWAPIEELHERLHEMAAAVRQNILAD